MPRIQVFNCPSCGARLTVEGDEAQVKCQFCDNTVIVPEELRPKRSAPPVIQIRTTRPSGAAGVLAVVALLLTVGSAMAIFLLMSTVQNKASEQVSSIQTSVVQQVSTVVVQTTSIVGFSATLAPNLTPPPGFAEVVLTFGGKGTGASLFDDARSIAVDDEGNLYVAEYSTGRVQKFDAEGKFITSWIAEGDTPLRGMAADRAGNVYVVRQGAILKYEGATGKLLDNIKGGDYFDDVAVLPDGGLVAASYLNRDDIVHLNADGEVVSRIEEAISGQTGDSELDTRVAVDGLGNIYALGHFNNAIFVFTPEGRFVNKFGSDGDEPGQFRAPNAIAVDGQSRVYVSDIKGIQIFDAEGRYLGVFEPPNRAFVFGMTFDDQNELFAVAGDQVFKFVLKGP